MPSARRLTVRSPTIDLMEDGAGDPLLFLHGGSPEADWIEHISDLAFHAVDETAGVGR